MKKKLFRQMLNEWRSNLWIFVEFLIVSVVLWYIADYFYATLSTRLRPRGFDTEHCYLLNLYEITDKSPLFIPDQTTEQKSEAKNEIMERLRRRPEVEAVSYSQNAYHYNGSNGYITFQYDTIIGSGLRRLVTPDFVKVFRYQGIDGETPDQLARELADGKILLTDNFFVNGAKKGNKGKKLSELGSIEISMPDDSAWTFRTGTPLFPMRYSDYTTWNLAAVLSPEAVRNPHMIVWMNELCIRVKPDMDHDIIETLMKEAQTQFHVGNYILTDVRSFDDIREAFQRTETNTERNYIVGMLFLLLNIFLGLLGTFWFRTQQRVKEVALRKVNGATSGQIFSRLITEGLVLLVIATVPALVVDYFLANAEVGTWADGYFTWPRLLICGGIAFLLMIIMVVLGIWFPARRAMKVDPARALADE